MKKAAALTVAALLFFSGVCLARTVKEYYVDGQLKSVTGFNKKGKRNGAYKLYWINGNLKETGTFKNGKIAGKPKRYSTDGILMGQPSPDEPDLPAPSP